MGWGPIGDILDTIINPGRGYEKAQQANQAGWNEAKDILGPYAKHGNEQYEMLNKAIQALMHPEELANQWASAYQKSPYAQRMLDLNTGQGLEEASRMGLMGSSGALNNIQQGAGNIVAQDRQAFLKDLMDKYLAGLGIGQNIYNQGANAAGNLAGGAQRFGEGQAGFEYGKSMAPWDMYNRFAGQIGSALMGGFGGGGMR